jgi:hypothetical protein
MIRQFRASQAEQKNYFTEASRALLQVAFDERRKIHDLLMEGVELALKKRGYPTIAEMKAKGKGR